MKIKQPDWAKMREEASGSVKYNLVTEKQLGMTDISLAEKAPNRYKYNDRPEPVTT